MNLWTMITVVAVCGMLSGVISNYLKHKALGRKNTAENDHATKHKLEALEERIKVLEEIVTDQNYQLKKQFEQL